MQYRALLRYGSDNRCELQVWQLVSGCYCGGYWMHVGWYNSLEAAIAECDRRKVGAVEVY